MCQREGSREQGPTINRPSEGRSRGGKPGRKLPAAWFGGRNKEGARGHASHGKVLRVAGSEVQAVRKEPCKELLVMGTVPQRRALSATTPTATAQDPPSSLVFRRNCFPQLWSPLSPPSHGDRLLGGFASVS